MAVASIASVEELKAQHAALEAKLSAEVQRATPDQSAIAELKRAKLRIKDRIASLTHA